MEKIINNPGLQNLAEKVFWNLDIEDLNTCAQINQSCKQILENPIFWEKKGLVILVGRVYLVRFFSVPTLSRGWLTFCGGSLTLFMKYFEKKLRLLPL